AAIADAHGLEEAGAAILAPLGDGSLGAPDAPFAGLIVLDGNLRTELLTEIAVSPLFTAADLRLAPASPGKVERLLPLLRRPRTTLYANLEEAGFLTGARYADAPTAAAGLIAAGAERVLVTDGPRAAAFHGPEGAHAASPPPLSPRHVTGAGDAFMAGHIAAELCGATPQAALRAALAVAAKHLEEDP
ncbi:MAG: PfkB family carbohydrate kinase, partial [Paracoccaceae bacterium]